MDTFISRAERGLSEADLRALHDVLPVMLGRRLADRLPHAAAEYVPGGHFAALARREKILSQIVG